MPERRLGNLPPAFHRKVIGTELGAKVRRGSARPQRVKSELQQRALSVTNLRPAVNRAPGGAGKNRLSRVACSRHSGRIVVAS